MHTFHRIRRHALLLSHLLLVVLLFAQFAQAAQPCPMATQAAAMAFDPQEMPCMASANACLADCTKSDQSPGHSERPVMVGAAPAILTVAEAPVIFRVACRAADSAMRTSDPPIPIRFCSFLN